MFVNEHHIHAIDVDPGRSIIYWTDTSVRSIKRALISEEHDQMTYSQDLKINNIHRPTGLSFDWVAKYVKYFFKLKTYSHIGIIVIILY